MASRLADFNVRRAQRAKTTPSGQEGPSAASQNYPVRSRGPLPKRNISCIHQSFPQVRDSNEWVRVSRHLRETTSYSFGEDTCDGWVDNLEPTFSPINNYLDRADSQLYRSYYMHKSQVQIFFFKIFPSTKVHFSPGSDRKRSEFKKRLKRSLFPRRWSLLSFLANVLCLFLSE